MENKGGRGVMNRSALEERINQLREYGRVFLSHKCLILFSTLLLSCGSAILIALLPDYYRATTTILVDPQKIPDRYVSSTVTSSVAERLNTLSQEVLSATRLQKIIDDLHLYTELRRSLTQEEIIEHMRQNIKIQIKEGSGQELRAFTITYQGREPVAVAEVANTLASTFIEWNLRTREQQVTGTTEFLEGHLREAKSDLEQQERKLREFKMRHLGEMPEQLQANLQALAGLRVALQANADNLNRLEQERLLLLRVPEAAVSTAGVHPPLSRRARLEAERRQLEQQLEELSLRYTPNHPDVEAAKARFSEVSEELSRLPPPQPEESVAQPSSAVSVRLELIDREMKRLKAEQVRILKQIDIYQAKVDAVPLREQQIADLTRNYERSKQHYDSLLDKTYGAQMAADLERKQKAEHFKILDPARIPAKPFKPNRLRLLAAAVFVSFCTSLGIVTLKEFLNTTIKMERELAEILPKSLPIIARIPTLVTRKDRQRQFWEGVLAVMVAVLIVVVTAGLLWRIHPIL